jgi:hypothetical protein
MDWSKAKDTEIREFMLDLWDREGIDISNGTGYWAQQDSGTRLGALQGLARAMDILLNSIEAGRLESLTAGIRKRRAR